MLAYAANQIFRFRMLFGLVVAALALKWMTPAPFLAGKYCFLHIAGIFVTGSGLALRAWGSGTAGWHTRSSTIEAPGLITGGPFAYVRNPIYLGSILIGIGMSTIISDPRAFLFAFAAFAILYLAIIPAEERYLSAQFGDAYATYRSAVPRMLPRLTPWPGRGESNFQWSALLGEALILLLLIAIYAALWWTK